MGSKVKAVSNKMAVLAFSAAVFIALFSFIAGCKSTGTQTSTAPPSGATQGVLSGNVTSSLNGKGIAGVTITTDPPVPGTSIATDANGSYKSSLPVGVYKVTYAKPNYTSAVDNISVVAGLTTVRSYTLKAAAAVVVSAGAAQSANPGSTLNVKASVSALDGSTVTGYKWTQTSGPAVTINNSTADNVSVTLPDMAAFKAAILKNVKFEERTVVQAVNPEALTTAQSIALKVTVTTSSGNYSANAAITANLPYTITSGIQNVPVGVPVLIHTKTQSAYNWTLTPPSTSRSAFDSPTSQNLEFTPDVAGKYTLYESSSNKTLDVYAGTWVGAITGISSGGVPLSASCTGCHSGTIAPDNFTSWRQTGHASIFTKNVNNPAGHYSESCIECHTVGYNPGVKNGGVDDAASYAAFVDSGMLTHGDPANWNNINSKYPDVAKLSNIQCENCHGPNNSIQHSNGKLDASRISISADVCGACHAEPPRHARFQQWELSGHANLELASDEGTVENRGATAGNCGRCHSGQGFLKWITQADMTKSIQGKNGNATVDELAAMGLTLDTVQPITCAVCHDPHAEGKSSGDPNTATVRVSGNTTMLPSGFRAVEVGRGAVCITCHNTRNGAHNDDIQPANYTAPHTPSQGDLLMGQNAYFVTTGQRSPHANITDTCVTCHMTETPPPAELSYQLNGTNHTFAADIELCSSCHTNNLNGKAFQTGYAEKLAALSKAMGDYLLKKIGTSVTVADYTPHTYNGKSYDVKSDTMVIDKSNIAAVEPTEPHGQQGFLIKLKTAVTVTYKPSGESPHSVSVTELQFQLGDITTDGKTALIPVTDNLVKAGWNYFLIAGDGSLGVHNPAYVTSILDASVKALK